MSHQRNILKSKLNNSRGFTLSETLVTVLIFMFMITGIYGIMLAGDASFQANKTSIELRQELRKAMDWMKDELKESGASAVNLAADGVPATSIGFQTSTGVSSGVNQWNGNTITFSLSSGQILRTESGASRVLAQDITTLLFSRESATPDTIDIQVIASRQIPRGETLTETLNFNVQMRN